jgi:hypothetical protein
MGSGGIHMSGSIRFVGIGDFGNKVASELSKIYEGLCDGRFDKEDGKYDAVQDHLLIHSFPSVETSAIDVTDDTIILAGSVHDPCWMEARKTLHESRPYLMISIGIDQGRGIDIFQPFPDECLVFPGPSLFDPVEVAQLALQVFFIHTPWNVSSRGSLIGYDLADTKQLFAGKVTKVRKMASDKEHCRQSFSKFLSENKADLCRAKGILMSFWSRDDVLSIPKANELWEEMKRVTIPDARQAFTYHILPEDGPDFMTTLFLTL